MFLGIRRPVKINVVLDLCLGVDLSLGGAEDYLNYYLFILFIFILFYLF